MIKFLRRAVILLFVSVLGVAGRSFLLNSETTDDRSDMNDPVFPEVMVDFDGNYANWNGNAIYLNNSNEGAIYNTEVKNVNKSVSGAVTITGGRTTVAGLNVNNNSVNNGNVYIAGNNVSFLKPGTYNTEFGKIETNKKINDYLEEMAKTIYNYWFIQFDFPDENGKPYKSSGGKMSFCNELNREIPQNWNYTSIGNITICLDSERIPLSNQQREGMKGSIPYYGATGIMDYVNRPIFSGNFVLLAEDGSVMDDNGNPILQRVSGDVWINNHTHVLQPVKGYSCRLLYLLLKDIPVSIIKTGSIQMKINQANLNNYNILSIPDAIRTQFINCVEPLDTKIMQIQQENNNLIQFRDWLLPMLMNGQATIED